MSQTKTVAICENLRKLAAEVRKMGIDQELRRTEKKADCAMALLGLELLARRITR